MRSEDDETKDEVIVAEARKWLEKRAKHGTTAAKPFLLVVNLNGASNIKHWPTMYKHFNHGRSGLQGGPAKQVPIPDLPPTLAENLTTKSATTQQAPRLLDSALQLLPSSMQRWSGY